MPITPAPETWFTSFERRPAPPDDILAFSGAISGDTVDTIADALDLGESHADIAATVGVTLRLVGVIRRVRHDWDDKRKVVPPPKKLTKTNGRRPTAPEGYRVVPAYQCNGDGDDSPHWTVFSPCLICRVRRSRENRRILAELG